MRNPGKTILLVEDEVIIAMAEAQQLEKEGYAVVQAYTGAEAISLVNAPAAGIDLILMDIDLGEGMDGTEAACEILKNRDIPVVFLSSHTEPDIVEKTEKITSYGYVVKNTGSTVLAASIKMAFRLHEANRQISRKNMEVEAANEDLNATVEEMEAANEELVRTEQDLIERERDLLESREEFRSYFNMSTVGMCVTSPQKGWIEVNDRLSAMLGYSKAELSSRTWAELTHPDDLDADVRLFDRVLAGTLNSYDLDKRFIRKDGSVIFTTLYVICKRNPDGSVHHILASLVDITERKKIEELLRAERDLGLALGSATNLEHAMRLCLETALAVSGMDSGGIYLLNPEGGLDLIIHAGLTEEFVRAGSHYDASTPNARLVNEKKPVYIQYEPIGLDLDMIGRTEGLQGIAIIPILDHGKVVACMNIASHTEKTVSEQVRISIEDIASRIGASIVRASAEESLREREAQYRALSELLQTSVQEKEILLRELKHRVKNNLGLVSNLLELEKERLIDEGARNVFINAQTRIESMTAIYEQLNRASGLDTVELPVYIADLANSLIGTYAVDPGRIRLAIDIDPVGLDLKRAVPLGLILNELITNAIKYAYPAPASGTIRISLKRRDGTIALDVADDGPGLPKDARDAGAGSLGLRLVDLLARQLGGTVTWENGKGTRVGLTLKE